MHLGRSQYRKRVRKRKDEVEPCRGRERAREKKRAKEKEKEKEPERRRNIPRFERVERLGERAVWLLSQQFRCITLHFMREKCFCHVATQILRSPEFQSFIPIVYTE